MKVFIAFFVSALFVTVSCNLFKKRGDGLSRVNDEPVVQTLPKLPPIGKRNGAACAVHLSLQNVHDNIGHVHPGFLKSYRDSDKCFVLQTAVNCMNKPIPVGQYCYQDSDSTINVNCDKVFATKGRDSCQSGPAEEDPFGEE